MIRINKKLKRKLGQPQLSLKDFRGSWDSPVLLYKFKGRTGQPHVSSKVFSRTWDSPNFLPKLKGKLGQNMIEYMLLFVCVVLVIFVALAPRGFLSVKINNSLDLAVKGVEGIANTVDDSY